MKFKRHILITGGAGFIGSSLVKAMVNSHPDYMIYNLDALTYCGNLTNLKNIKDAENYKFIYGDICDKDLVETIFRKYDIDGVMHLAAESHVDNSILYPEIFEKTNVQGTVVLLNAAKRYWEGNYEGKMFLHVSTDEVYGTLPLEGNEKFTEKTPYSPHSPYSAAKAGSDFFVQSYHDTYGLPTLITHCSNNYGPYQYPEKLIPLTIMKVKNKEPIPVYGTGENIRDWIYVGDHCEALKVVFEYGTPGEVYNIGGNSEIKNIDVVRGIIYYADQMLGREENEDMNLITFVEDRKGHDLRYAIDTSKIMDEIGWTPKMSFEQGLFMTVEWYLTKPEYTEEIMTRQKNVYENTWELKK